MMNVYFYHTQDIQYMLREYAKGRFPGHLLYGALHLGDHGIGVTWHHSIASPSRLRQMLHSLWGVLRSYRSIDAIYATHYRGLELVVLLRALRLLRKPLVVWHHQPIITPPSCWRRWLGRLFYRGFDHLFFFSQKLINDSLPTGKVSAERMHLGHWGPDLDFYDRLLADHPVARRQGFVSTGKELRDMPTLVNAFNQTGCPLDIYLNRRNGEMDYMALFTQLHTEPNVHVHFVQGLIPYELSMRTNEAACAAVCCQESKYTVGLTTVVDAMGLGLPILCSRNPQMPFSLPPLGALSPLAGKQYDGMGLSVAYNDVEGWTQAISYVNGHPDEAAEMGRAARRLAEQCYNDRQVAAEVAEILLVSVR